jgi:hypothetical protein
MPLPATGRTLAAAIALALAPTLLNAHAPSVPPALTMMPLGSVITSGAEIAAHDPQSQRLFVTDAGNNRINIIDLRNPASPAVAGAIDLSTFGSPTSVAVRDGIVAVAIANSVKTEPGTVALYTNKGTPIVQLRVGALPDMLTFTPDGRFLLVANEGEPSGYGAGHVDPEGSISIIPMPKGFGQLKKLKNSDVRTADFRAFIGQEEALRAKGIRIDGPGANAAQDLEPEYIAVSPDSKTAYVTLQENNAVAVVDIAAATVREVRPLGYKDYNKAPYVTGSYEWPQAQLPSIGKTAAGQSIRLGGFSGLFFEGTTADGKLRFIANTDRGPNGEPNAAGQRPFLLPQFSPRLVRFHLDPASGQFDLVQQIILRNSDGTPLSGLPNTVVAGGNSSSAHNDEVPVDLFGNVLPLDPLGGDFEGVVVADDGSFWLCDEYRPAIYHFDAQGRLIERFVPAGSHAAAGLPVPAPGVSGALGIEALPAVLGQRRQNRGFEALALKDGKLYAFVQSPLRNPAALGNATLNAMRNIRVVEFNPASYATRQFLYLMDNPVPVNSDDSRADKIGDAVSVPGSGFLVIERDDDALPEDDLTTISKKVYAFDLRGATDISAIDTLYDVGGVTKSLDQMSAAELASVGVTPISKRLHVDLAAAGYGAVEKFEGLALLDDGRLAVINDNDFGVAQIAIDYASGTFTTAPGYTPEPVLLALISVPGLDASDRDNAINIRNWPVLGMYQPDAIATFSARGRTYLVTANEGDARDWPGFTEEIRVGAGGYRLDATRFPDAATLKQNANLGRLTVTRTLGDDEGDGDFDAIYTFGGRSFSIWSAKDGAQLFDSDAALERITAAAYPAHFNASNDNNHFDDRSDNKGPEPEGLAIGTIGERTYAFVGLERIGGIAAWDITNPTQPLFVDYVNNRDFSVSDITSPEIGDLGPEGVLFIPAHESPSRASLLVVTNEINGSVTLFGLDVCSRWPGKGNGAHWWKRNHQYRFGWHSRCER